MEKRLNLQLFAEEQTTPTQVESQPSATNEENVDFEESTKETESSTQKEESKSKTTRQQNYNNAQKRIEAKKKAEEEKAKRESYLDGLKKASGAVNQFTGEPLNDDDDIKEYEIMLEIKKNGGDPIEDYRKYVKEKSREQRLAQEKEEQNKLAENKRIDDEVQEMVAKYGKEKVDEIFKDEVFGAKADMLIKKNSIGNIYEVYKSAYDLGYEKAKKEIEESQMMSDARRASSSGSFGSGESKSQSISDLSDEEFTRLVNMVSSRV